MTHDVAVIGGGPAGAAVATLLARQGHRCLIVDRAVFPRYWIGESLIPHTYGPLSRLGLIPSMKQSQFVPKHSVRFVSPSGADSEPFYFSETIEGDAARTWQVERSEFDRMCLDNAVETGVEVWMGAQVESVLFDGERATGVRVVQGDESKDVAARVVVDASGRATVLGRQLGLRDGIASLLKTSVWSYFRGGARRDGIDAGETTIFLLPENCWAWYIPLSEDIVSVGVVGDPLHVLRGGISIEDAFVRGIVESAPLLECLEGAERVDQVRGGGVLAYCNKQTVGDGWVMLGDARAFLDPIYSSGVFLALASAELAAPCIHDALESDDVSAQRLGRFEPELTGGVRVISALIHAFYDPAFSFRSFLKSHPEQRRGLIDCLVGDVFKDMAPLCAALESHADTGSKRYS